MNTNHNALGFPTVYDNLLWPINPFRFLFRLGKVVNQKKVQAEGFEKYFNKGSGKFESNDVDLSEVVAIDENKAKDGVSSCQIYHCQSYREPESRTHR